MNSVEGNCHSVKVMGNFCTVTLQLSLSVWNHLDDVHVNAFFRRDGWALTQQKYICVYTVYFICSQRSGVISFLHIFVQKVTRQ